MAASFHDHEFHIHYAPADDPLHNFYIPALSASVQYDRSAGFFSSSALAVAAAGVAGLIQNGGHMRLLVGADLDERDVEAIRRGHDPAERVSERMLARFAEPTDALMVARLEALAWMVAEGTLQVKVVLPKDPHGHPIPAQLARDYYHPKTGIFTDAAGDRVAFSGSVNESETGWRNNYETFLVLFSWEATRPHLEQVAINFERLWEGREPNWIALDIPTAVRERLLQYRPAQAPTRDPLARPEAAPALRDAAGRFAATAHERVLFQFLRDAPYLPNATDLGAQTSAIRPWPHQARVARSVLARFPERALLCDEVGLGKTIEAGLVLRQLWISGRVRRGLILAPKSVLRQWQEELYEKFALEVPRYDARQVWDVHGRPLGAATDMPWDEHDLLLASSQLAKRRDRLPQLEAAEPWDLLIVDEAHHARRKDFKEAIYRPNRLLTLLNALKDRVGAVLLMTATPMQVHALEVWDLLTVLGMGGRWGASEADFLAFFEQLRLARSSFENADWDLLFDLVTDHLGAGGQFDPTFAEQARAALGPVNWATLAELPHRKPPRWTAIKQLPAKARPYVVGFARNHTPINYYLYRSTRELLRTYIKRGVLQARVPARRPRRARIAMRPEEYALYHRIDEYISEFYQKYEDERRGLGFIMTVYRRRLTSSFYAVRRSLERRLDFLRGVISLEDALEDDDVEQDELDFDVSEEVLTPARREQFELERSYVEDFVGELRELSVADSKMEQLKAELERVFRERDTVLVFTQYTDTMDYLRGQLVDVYGSAVACYSGRGGEVWNGIGWADTTKEDVKSRFRAGQVRILLCTESASEGLNLQTCGVLINYDMPWNPMRVEQRIGRVDRIGQVHAEVWISNYFYTDTIEDRIYQALSDRIDWFENVVGELQPILADVGEVTRRLAMLPASEVQAQFEAEMKRLRDAIQQRETASLNLDDYLTAEEPQSDQTAPVVLSDLEQLLTESRATGALFQPHPEIPHAFLLDWRGETLPVTFAPECFDEHPASVRFLTYGSPLLQALLESVAAPAGGEWPGRLWRTQSDAHLDLRGWYEVDGDGVKPVESLAQLRSELAAEAAPAFDAARRKAASAHFAAEAVSLQSVHDAIRRRRVEARYRAALARARRLLTKAALVEIALGRNPDLFDQQSYPTAFSEQAVRGLQRHGYPWGPLLALAFGDGLAPREEDPYWREVASAGRDALKSRSAQLRQEARRHLPELSEAANVWQSIRE